MRVLLDTCVLADLRRRDANPDVMRAVNEIEDGKLFVSVISIGEIIRGIALLEEGKRRRELGAWVAGLERRYAERIIAVDIEITRIWGEITAGAAKTGKVIPAVDGLIAATAIRHGLHLMTRDVSCFAPAGALIINPYNGSR